MRCISLEPRGTRRKNCEQGGTSSFAIYLNDHASTVAKRTFWCSSSIIYRTSRSTCRQASETALGSLCSLRCRNVMSFVAIVIVGERHDEASNGEETPPWTLSRAGDRYCPGVASLEGWSSTIELHPQAVNFILVRHCDQRSSAALQEIDVTAVSVPCVSYDS